MARSFAEKRRILEGPDSDDYGSGGTASGFEVGSDLGAIKRRKPSEPSKVSVP